MTTTQIIMLGILAIIMIISYFGTALIKTDTKRMIFIVIWAFASGFTLLIAILQTENTNELKKLNGKCPEYERIDNLYKLKE